MILTNSDVNDVIAVVYEVNEKQNSCGAIETTKHAIKIDRTNNCYYLNPFRTYYIICANSRFIYKNNRLECSYSSIIFMSDKNSKK